MNFLKKKILRLIN